MTPKKTPKKTTKKTTKRGGSENGFKPGKSGNPDGRPVKGATWNDLFESVMGETIAEDSEVTLKEATALSLGKLAAAGDIKAAKLIMERMDGMPKQMIDVTEHAPDEVVEIGFDDE